MVNAADLKSVAAKAACGFEPHARHWELFTNAATPAELTISPRHLRKLIARGFVCGRSGQAVRPRADVGDRAALRLRDQFDGARCLGAVGTTVAVAATACDPRAGSAGSHRPERVGENRLRFWTSRPGRGTDKRAPCAASPSGRRSRACGSPPLVCR